MTQERFSRYLDDPELLSEITYEELKTLALAYPYAHNLRYLLALKSRQIGHHEHDRNVAAAAAASLDREQLYAMFAPALPVKPAEVLQLKPIAALQQELEALTPVQIEVEEPAVVALAAVMEKPAPAAVEPPPPQHQEPAPEAPTLGSRWMGHFNLPVLGVSAPESESHQPPATVPKKQSAKPATVAQKLAEKSVTENIGVVSLSLAQLYAKQGHRDKALAMYEQLILQYPERAEEFKDVMAGLRKG